MMWRGESSWGSCKPEASNNACNASKVLRWKFSTRSALLGTTSAICRLGSWVVTPVGQLPVWQVCACMHPSANIKPRALLHQSAPSANARAISNALTIFPLAPTRMCSRKPAPTKVLCTKRKPSCSGIPIWSENSKGAAPVPPSAPSTTTKSG